MEGARDGLAGTLSFYELTQLPAHELRKWLRDDDARSRMQAAWAVAVGLAGLEAQVPTPEKRRLFVMNLAVVEDREALGVLAELDPDSLVRVYASQYLARLLLGEEAHGCELLFRLSVSDEHPEVRATIIRDLPEELVRRRDPELPRRWLRDTSREVRRTALEALLRWSTSSAQFLQRVSEQSRDEERYAMALELLGERGGGSLRWAEVPEAFLQLSPGVMVELVRLFEGRPTAAPIRHWLECALMFEALCRRGMALYGLTKALEHHAEIGAALTEDEEQLARRALAQVERLVPAYEREPDPASAEEAMALVHRPHVVMGGDVDPDEDEWLGHYEMVTSPYHALWQGLRQLLLQSAQLA